MLKSQPLLLPLESFCFYSYSSKAFYLPHIAVCRICLSVCLSGLHEKERKYEKIISDVAFNFKRAPGAGH